MQLQSIQPTDTGYITERRFGRKRVKAVLFQAFIANDGTQLLKPLTRERIEEIGRSHAASRRPSVRVVEISPAAIVPPVERSNESMVTILMRGNARTLGNAVARASACANASSWCMASKPARR